MNERQGALYFADDKDVIDLLESSSRRLTAQVLREFFQKKRHTWVSNLASREDLARLIATWTLDWEDICWLQERAHSGDRVERRTVVSIGASLQPDMVQQILSRLRTDREQHHGEKLDVSQIAPGNLRVNVAYSELDPGKTRLRQRRAREGALQIEVSADRISIQHEANPKMQAVASALVQALAAEAPDQPQARRVSLTHLPGLAERTEFFMQLTRSIPNHDLVDVTWASVHRPVVVDDEVDEETDTASVIEQEDEDVNDVSPSGIAPRKSIEAGLLRGMVKNAVLRGQSILVSPEYHSLRTEFYLSGLQWIAQEPGEQGRRIHLEAGFGDPVSCTDFHFGVVAVTPLRKRGNTSEFVGTRNAPTSFDEEKFSKLLVAGAEAALAKVEKGSTNSPSERESE